MDGPNQVEADRDAGRAFVDMEPYTFGGGPNAADLTTWTHQVECYFQVCHVPAHLQVPLAASLLRGPAIDWWRLERDLARTEDWRGFCESLETRFQPHRYGQRRFIDLVRHWGSLPGESMYDYAERFRATVIPNRTLGVSDLCLCNIFWRGVTASIRRRVFYPPPFPADIDNFLTEVAYAEIEENRSNNVPVDPTSNNEDERDVPEYTPLSEEEEDPMKEEGEECNSSEEEEDPVEDNDDDDDNGNGSQNEPMPLAAAAA